jgi:thioredoxin 1
MLKRIIQLVVVINILCSVCIYASTKSNQNISKKSIQLSQASQAQKQIKVTFVELGSKNCIPCKMMQKVMNDIEKDYSNQVKIVFHDVWTKEGEVYGEKYGIRAIPTQVFLDKNGKEYFRHEGFFSKEEVVKVLQQQGVNKN